MKLNNVDVNALEATVEAARADPAKARRVNRVQGSWNLVDGQPQFVAVLGFDSGEQLLEADQPPPQGGGGLAPGPVQYCLFGLASCFAATFAANAAMAGLAVRKLRVAAEADVNFSRVYGLSEEPIIEGVRLALDVDSDAPLEELRQVEEMATRRCPAVFCMTNAVRLETSLRRATSGADDAALAAIARRLAEDHPSAAKEEMARQFRSVLDTALPLLSRRAAAAQAEGKATVEQIWLTIKSQAEEDFERALPTMGRPAAVFVASKFMNNQGFGLSITEVAAAAAASREGSG
jgi:uncharacterized OsmC-like protein